MTDRREEIAWIISGAPFPSKRSYDKADAILSLPSVQGVTEKAVEAAMSSYHRGDNDWRSATDTKDRMSDMRRVLEGYESTRTPAPVGEPGKVVKRIGRLLATYSAAMSQEPDSEQVLAVLANLGEAALGILPFAASALTAKDEEIKRLKEQRREIGTALVAQTVGGSEFYRRDGDDYIADVKACVTYLNEKKDRQHNLIKDSVRRATTAERERDEARKALEKIADGKGSDRYFARQFLASTQAPT
jgi:hypothetical protein